MAMFGKTVYENRRKRLTSQMDSGLILFVGNQDSPMNYTDNTYLFRQDSSFLYFFGLDYQGLAAVLDIDSGEEILFGNDVDIDDIIWKEFYLFLKELIGFYPQKLIFYDTAFTHRSKIGRAHV